MLLAGLSQNSRPISDSSFRGRASLAGAEPPLAASAFDGKTAGSTTGLDSAEFPTAEPRLASRNRTLTGICTVRVAGSSASAA
jgi:hypothetical protein